MKKICILWIVLVIMLIAGCSIPASNQGAQKDKPTATQSEPESSVKGESTISPTATASPDVKIETVAIVLYYQDSQGFLIPVTRKVAKLEGIARAAMTGLVDTSISREELEYFGLYPILPEGTEILGLSIKEGLATIDFNDKLLSYKDASAERNIIGAIVYTLTEFSTVDNVKILVQGKEKGKLEYETDISGILNRDNILVNAGKANIKDGLKKSDVYLYREQPDKTTFILPVSVEYNEVDYSLLPNKIVELLGREMKAGELYSDIPAETEVIRSSIEGSLLTLDFSSKLIGYEGEEKEAGILQQILHSMKQISGIKQVKIKVDGKSEKLPEGTDISKALAVPVAINDVVDKAG